MRHSPSLRECPAFFTMRRSAALVPHIRTAASICSHMWGRKQRGDSRLSVNALCSHRAFTRESARKENRLSAIASAGARQSAIRMRGASTPEPNTLLSVARLRLHSAPAHGRATSPFVWFLPDTRP